MFFCKTMLSTPSFLYIIILILVARMPTIFARGKRVDIFGGQGDILQLRNTHVVKNAMMNAIPQDSDERWTTMQDSNGNYLIPYVISGKFDSEEQQTIRQAMLRIASNTCIRFITRTNEKDFVDLKNEYGEGCVEPDIVLHELLHAIGLWHEHMRSDRDDYIKVLFDNIEPEYHSQFEKVSPSNTTTYGLKYDYRSVMHYAKNAFARPGRMSMQTRETEYQDVIGHVTDASPNDYCKVCWIYKCHRCMGQSFNATWPNELIPTDSDGEDIISGNGVLIGQNSSTQSSNSCKDISKTVCGITNTITWLKCKLFLSHLCCKSCMTALS